MGVGSHMQKDVLRGKIVATITNACTHTKHTFSMTHTTININVYIYLLIFLEKKRNSSNQFFYPIFLSELLFLLL